MTLDIYSQVIPDLQRGATEALNGLLGSHADHAEDIATVEGEPFAITGKQARDGVADIAARLGRLA